MSALAPIDPKVRRRMRQVISIAIATRSCAVNEAAAEARRLGMGLQPALPASMVDAVVTDLLKELGAYAPSLDAVEVEGQLLRAVLHEEVVDTLAYAMRFDEHGKARRTGVEYASTLAAEALVRSLDAGGFVLVRRHPAPPQRAGGA